MLTLKTKIIRVVATTVSIVSLCVLAAPLLSDPCGMVPPIYTGPGSPIKRIGLQQTYVFFDEGVESFVIRPGFEGKVDNFGMLIPFPSAPALRKVPDNVFEQIAAAADPPEVVIDLFPVNMLANQAAPAGGGFGGGGGMALRKNQVTVLKQEAVGMYEVAVLEAGSANALKLWMDKHKYQYPEGMDKVTEDYIDEGWCFVAVKTKVGEKAAADPRPGQRQARPEMPDGSVFDGNVQGLGFRFRTDELVVPMRLSAFNEGDLRNVVYLLTKGEKKIRAIPEEYVVRQIGGAELIANMTEPLDVRIIGNPGGRVEIPKWRRQTLPKDRNPEPHNGIAKQLFVSDMMALSRPDLSLDHEETEKELLRIGERFGLRGVEIDREIEAVSKDLASSQVKQALPKLKDFTLTIVDGDFPREVLANQNLKFSDYRMAAARNKTELYDTKQHKAGGKKNGQLISHLLDDPEIEPGKLEFEFIASNGPDASNDHYIVRRVTSQTPGMNGVVKRSLFVAAGCLLFGLLLPNFRRRKQDRFSGRDA
ncbi:MAG: DUF2330 domain-containing protein [Planctomycetota bacterium]